MLFKVCLIFSFSSKKADSPCGVLGGGFWRGKGEGGRMVFVWLGKRTLFWQIGVPPWRLGSSGRHLLSVSIWGMLAPESLWSKACMVAEMGTLYTMLQVMTACRVCVYSVYSKRGIFLCFCWLQLNTVVIIVFGQQQYFCIFASVHQHSDLKSNSHDELWVQIFSMVSNI